jgi:hypothetical protein
VGAGVVGVLIAWEGLRVIVALRPLALDRLADVGIEIGAVLVAVSVIANSVRLRAGVSGCVTGV